MNELNALIDAIEIVRQARLTVVTLDPVWQKLNRVGNYLNTVLDTAMKEYFTEDDL